MSREIKTANRGKSQQILETSKRYLDYEFIAMKKIKLAVGMQQQWYATAILRNILKPNFRKDGG